MTSDLDISTIDALFKDKSLRLTALFAPEHGIRGDKTAGATFPSYRDPVTGLWVHSIYDSSRTYKPTPEMLRDVDVLVVDLQDVGARCFTYISTMALSLRAVSEEKDKGMVILDRLNPIGAREIDMDGPILDPRHQSFVGIWQIPLQHGMTMGELALLFNREMGINLQDLHVVRAQNYDGRLPLPAYDGHGFGWIPPSPNLPTYESSVIYPGTVLFEATRNVSIGRGTPDPFHVIGAPFIDPWKLLAHLDDMRRQDSRVDAYFENVKLVPAFFVPTTSYHANQQCSGVRIVMMNRAKPVRAIPLALTIMRALVDLHGAETLRLSRDNFVLLNGNDNTTDMFLRGEPLPVIVESWKAPLAQFSERRRPFLLYR